MAVITPRGREVWCVLLIAMLFTTVHAATADEAPKSDGEVIWNFFRDRVLVPAATAVAVKTFGARGVLVAGAFLAASTPIAISDESTYSSDGMTRAQQKESASLRQKREAVRELEAAHQLEIRGGQPPTDRPSTGPTIQLPQLPADYPRHRHSNTAEGHRTAANQAQQRALMLQRSADDDRQAALRDVARQRAQVEPAPTQTPPPRRPPEKPRLPPQPSVRVAPPR